MNDHRRRFTGTAVMSLSGLCLTFATGAYAAGATAAAAGPPDVAAPDQTSLKQVVVTGSLIPTNPDAVAVPVISLDAAALSRIGVAGNMLDTLRKALPDFAGRSNAGASNAQNHNQFTAGGSQIELRNLPTLVLVDGERVALDAVAGLNGSKDFVDVSQIPAAALERVDVLADGASSLYGSDAIGGVVNFILKRNYHGLSFGGHYGAADGGYSDRSYFVTGGTDFGPVNITATASISQTSPLWQYQRSFASPAYGVTPGVAIPGVVGGGAYVLAPGLNAPNVPTGAAATAASYAQLASAGVYNATSATALSNAFDYSRYAMLLQSEKHENFVATINSKDLFGGRTRLFGDIMVSRNKVQSTAWQAQGAPFSALSLTVPAGSPYDPLTSAATGVTFADSALPKGVFDTTDAYRLTAGLKGQLGGGWSWQTSLDYSESKLTEQDTNLLYKPNGALAVAGGYDSSGNPVAGGTYSKVFGGDSINNALVLQPALDPFAVGGLPSAALANLYGTEVLNADSKLYSWDAHTVGTLFRLPAGKVSVAFGLNWRREEISGHADANGRVTDPVTGLVSGNDQNWVGGLYTDPFTHGRDDSAVYAETRIPLASARMRLPALHEFELLAAGRFEHYSDAGSNTTPKFGFRWEPIDAQFVVHGTYSKSFVAPPLYQAYGPFDLRTAPGSIAGSVLGANYADLATNSFNAEDGANAALEPAVSVSRSIGFVFRPKRIEGLEVNADFSSINLYGFAGGIGFNNIFNSVNNLGSASPFFNNLGVGQFTNLGGSDPFGAPGALKTFLTNPTTGLGDPAKLSQLYLVDRFTNLAVLRERSWSVGATYVLPWSRYGTYTLSTNGAVFDSFKFSDGIPGDAAIQYAGNASDLGVFAGTLPKYRFYSTADWNFRSIDVTLANTYISSVEDAGLAGTSPGIPVSSYSVWDLRGAYDWRFGTNGGQKLSLAVGVNNIANTMPPLAPRAFGNQHTNADIATYSPIGRLVYGDVTVSF
ncbi:MAG TPA: TonB-dependent receptor plug domain-containing protein [Steroidobacteraceae bacterium]|nr:TonB-dependent receptor plug domain-containing protein [Steroidobacteraceae bacterium]